MEEIIRQAFLEKNDDLLQDLLLHNSNFLEMQHVLGENDFRFLFQNLELFQIGLHQYLELETTNLYYFITGGLIMVKDIEKNCRIKRKKGVFRKTAICEKDKRSPVNLGEKVPKLYLSKIEDFIDLEERQIGFYYSTEESNLVLKLSAERIPKKIIKNLQNYFYEKLKFLNRLEIFADVPRSLIQENLEKFIFTKISFNNFVYGKDIRNGEIFILYKGEIIVESNNGNSIIVDSPNILGFEKINEYEEARCLTEFAICYSIEKTCFEELMRKNSFHESRDIEGQRDDSRQNLRVNFLKSFSNFHEILSDEKTEEFPLEKKFQNTDKSFFSQKEKLKPLLKKGKFQNTKEIALEQGKKERIIDHFSNTFSSKFSSSISHMSQTVEDFECRPILYEIKVNTPKMPDYQELKKKLKKMRLKRIIDAKENFNKSCTTDVVMSLRESSEFKAVGKKTGIDAKIQRNLELFIANKLNKKYKFYKKII